MKTTTPIIRPNAALLGTTAQRDAFADIMLTREYRLGGRMAEGAFTTFFLFRREGMTASDAHQCVRRWAYEFSPYAPNPLSLAVRRSMRDWYSRQHENISD